MAEGIGSTPTEADFEPLDMEELKLLPAGLKDQYMTLERLYGDKGWDYVKAWASKSADEQVIRILTAPNWEQTVYARGMRDGFLQVLQVERMTAFQFRNMIRELLAKQAEVAEAQAAAEEQSSE